MVKVKYVGKKPFCTDNVARSGKSWAGHGDVQEVTPAQAKILTRYADQWVLVNAADADLVQAPQTVQVEDAAGEQVDVTDDVLNKPLEKMSTAELVALARVKYGRTLKAGMGKKNLLDTVTEIVKTNDPIA